MSNRLPETELANWSFLSLPEKRVELQKFERPKKVIGSYEPFRRVFPDAVNQQFPLFGDTFSEVGWEEIETRLVQECKGDEQKIRMNRRILAATHSYAREHGIAASSLDVVPLRFVRELPYEFGLNLLIRYPNRAAVAFLDMRRSNRLKPNGLAFVFSALHHRFRVAYADLASVDTEIWRYGTTTNRTLTAHSFTGEVLEWDAMVADVRETYAIWDEVKRGDQDRRRAAGGGSGPLFDRA